MRYSRLESLPGVGSSGIGHLLRGRVLVIGCGALGSLCAMYLGASGVGTVGIADFDTIDLSNLQRQLFFDEASLGKSKCATLAERIRAINSEIKVIEYASLVKADILCELAAQYDFVIDGSDNPATKHQTASICEELGVPYCIGGVREFSGQVMTWTPGHAGYAEIFGATPDCSGVTPCSIGGVLGPAAGVVASVQASQALIYLTGAGNLLTDRLFTFDLSTPSANIL